MRVYGVPSLRKALCSMLLIVAPDLKGGEHCLCHSHKESEAQMGPDSGNWGVYSGKKLRKIGQGLKGPKLSWKKKKNQVSVRKIK